MSERIVYAHYVDGECFYIGSGTWLRPYLFRERSDTWKSIAKGKEVKVVILAQGMTKRESLAVEESFRARYDPPANMRRARRAHRFRN